MAYIGKSPTGSGVRQRYVYTATGGETSLSGADDNSKTLKFTDGEYVDVHLNGVLLVQGTDYGVGTANTISSLAALAANDVVEITVYDVYNVAKINSEAMRNRWYFTATGGETSITTSEVAGLSFNANAEIEVRLNGVSLQQGVDFNTTTANQVGGLAALTAGQVVEIIHYADFQLADTVSKAAGGTFTGDVTIDNNLNVGTIKDETGTNTALSINSDGVVTKPNTVLFHVHQTSEQTGLSDSAWTKVTFDAALYNVGSHFDLTNNYFKPTVAGYYMCYANTWVHDNGGSGINACFASFYKNGSRLYDGEFSPKTTDSDTAEEAAMITGLVYLNGTTDYLESRIWINTSANTAGKTQGGNSERVYFGGHLVG